jgi:hypothetical protein
MQKRSLRILKRSRNIPVRGICEACKMEFFADAHNLGQAAIQQQFNAHKCKSEATGQISAGTSGPK